MASKNNDEALLQELGYEQKLTRSWTWVQSFGVSFSIISIVTGITTLFGTGLNTGGPAGISIGWPVVCVGTMPVAIAMAEICSAIPTSGGPYYWAAALAPKKYSPFLAWLTGWFNLLGQVAVTTGITFGLAGVLTTLITVQHPSFEVTAAKTLGIYAAALTSHILINIFALKALKYLNNLSIVMHSVGVLALVIALLAKAPSHQPASFVFGKFYDGTGDPGWSVRASPAYVAVISILLSQYTITGFDASAHLSEETTQASRNAPIGIIMSVSVSAVFGWVYILALLFCIQDFDLTVGSEYGSPPLTIFINCFGQKGGVAALSYVACCIYMAGLFSMTSNSRMLYAFARDRGLPRIFDSVSDRWQVPIRTILLGALLSFLLAVPSLGSTVAFAAATAIATIGLYISYVIPTFIGLVWHKSFKKGAFDLGRASRPIAAAAVLWVGFILVVLCLPTATPVTSQTLNYTPVAVGIVAFGVLASWFLSARKWFKGPLSQVEESLARMPSAGGNVEMLDDMKEKGL